MATELDLINKQDKTFNTGVKGTDIDLEKIIGLIFTPMSATIDLTADLKTQLDAGYYNSNKNNRFFALPAIAEATDNSTEAKKVQWAYGSEHTVSDGYFQGVFFPHNPGKAVMKVLRKFNGMHNKFRVLLIDDQFRVLCTKDPLSGAVRGFTLMDIWSDAWKFNTGAGTKLGIRLAFLQTKELTDYLHVIDAGYDVIGSCKTVNDVSISVATALATRVVTVFATTNDGHDNLFDLYGAELAGISNSQWVGTVFATGAALTISTVAQAIVNGKKAMTITFSSSGYPTTGSVITLALGTLANLDTAGVSGYESNVLQLTV